MKRVSLTLGMFFLFLFINSSLYAQQKTTSSPGVRAAKITGWMRTNLELTDDQLTKVQTINLKYANKTEEIKNSPTDRIQKSHMLKSNDNAKDAELKQVLTDSQYKTYLSKKKEIEKKVKKEIKADMKEGGL